MANDAVQKIPTVEQEMSRFSGFSTTDGEVSDGKQTPAETAALAKVAEFRSATANNVARSANAAAEAEAMHNEQEQATTQGDDVDETADEGEAADEAEVQEGEDAATPPVEQPKGPKKKETAQERINALTRRARSAERALDLERTTSKANQEQYERRLTALEGRSSTPLTTEKASVKVDPNAPKPANYEMGELDAQYIADVAVYAYKQEAAKGELATKAQKATEQQTAAQAAFSTKFQAFQDAGTKEYGDTFVEDVVNSGKAGEWPLPDTVGELIFGSPVGHRIAKFLSENVKEAQRIEKLAPTQQAVEFGKLEVKFSAKTPAAGDQGTTPPKVTRAPQPPQHRARGGNSGTPAVDGATSDFAAFEKAANAALG